MKKRYGEKALGKKKFYLYAKKSLKYFFMPVVSLTWKKITENEKEISNFNRQLLNRFDLPE